MLLVEIKDFNLLIDNKTSRNNDYTTRNLLDYWYHQNFYKPIGTDLLRQINTSISQQINFTGTLAEDNGVTMFFIAENHQK